MARRAKSTPPKRSARPLSEHLPAGERTHFSSRQARRQAAATSNATAMPSSVTYHMMYLKIQASPGIRSDGIDSYPIISLIHLAKQGNVYTSCPLLHPPHPPSPHQLFPHQLFPQFLFLQRAHNSLVDLPGRHINLSPHSTGRRVLLLSI